MGREQKNRAGSCSQKGGRKEVVKKGEWKNGIE
jgi:hypothetical protein